MFNAVLTRTGLPNQAVHIGDHLSDDILGANNAGMLSIWYNHNGAFTNDPFCSSGEVHRLSDLPESIESLNPNFIRVSWAINEGRQRAAKVYTI